MNRNPGLVVFGLVLAAGLVLTGWVIAGPIREMKAAGQTMTVTGSSIRRVQSDFATWSSTLRVRGENVQAAYATMKVQRAQVLTYLHAHGVKDSDLSIPPISTSAVKKANPNGYGTTEEVIGYELTVNFKVSSHNVDFLVKLAQDATELLEQGLFFESSSPEFFYSGLEKLKVELAGEAAANAQQRAGTIADKTGTALGAPRGVRVGVFQLRPVNSTEVSDDGMLDTSSREKEAMAVVTINFSIGG